MKYYPASTCYFCNKSLKFSSLKMEFVCSDSGCNSDYHYWVEEDFSQIGFKIKDWHFTFFYSSNVTEFTNAKQRIIFNVPAIFDVNKDNYLEVVNRCQKLQLLQ